jgi:hypothetical protein
MRRKRLIGVLLRVIVRVLEHCCWIWSGLPRRRTAIRFAVCHAGFGVFHAVRDGQPVRLLDDRVTRGDVLHDQKVQP